MSKLESSRDPDASIEHLDGQMKPEPMALATGSDVATDSQIAPEASAYT